MLFRGFAQGRNVLGGIGIGLRKAVGYCCESEGGKAVERVGTSGFQETFAVELCVDESDMKSSVVQEFGQLHHWVYVALSWVGDADCMGLLH